MINKVHCLDCETGIDLLKDNSVDMIFTSPPYAEQRDGVYDGIPVHKYVDWFTSICNTLYYKMKDDASFFLNIKEHSVDGFRSTYVLKLILAITEQTGFGLIDTFAWTKNAFPSRQINKFKNGWEPIYHFAKQKNIKFHPERVAEPIKEESLKRANRAQVGVSTNGSGFAQPDLEKIGKITMALPSNHLHISNVHNQFSRNMWHPAVFPRKLVDFFIEAYTDIGDVILDPFIGSGTTAISATELGRHFVGFENNKDYCKQLHNTYGFEIVYYNGG